MLVKTETSSDVRDDSVARRARRFIDPSLHFVVKTSPVVISKKKVSDIQNSKKLHQIEQKLMYDLAFLRKSV